MQRINVLLTNRSAYLEPPYQYKKLLREWSFSKPGFHHFGWRFPGWDGRVKLLHKYLAYGKVSSGLFRATYREIERKYNLKFVIEKERKDVRRNGRLVLSSGKYTFQNNCVTRMLAAVRRGGGLVTNATASGKTRIAGMFCAAITGNVCFIVDQLDLLGQARKEIASTLNEKVGIIGNSQFETERVTVATIQTLHRHRSDAEYSRFVKSLDALFIDEIHTQMNRRNFQTVAKIQPKAVFGLTATLQLKKKHVRLRAYELAGPVLFEYPVEQGMRENVLARGVVVRIRIRNSAIPLESIGYTENAQNRVLTNDFDRNELEDDEGSGRSPDGKLNCFNSRPRNGHNSNFRPWRRFVEAYSEHIVENTQRNVLIRSLARYAVKRNRYCIVLAERKAHVRELSRLLRKTPHRIVFGEIAVEDRDQARDHFEAGGIKLIIASRVFQKGVNIKRVDTMIDSAAMRSADNALQKFGRALRQHADKRGVLYFDIADDDPETAIQLKRLRKRLRQAKAEKNKIMVRRLRDEIQETRNPFAEAARERKKAFEAAGLRVIDVYWDETVSMKSIFRKANAALAEELSK